jgi:argininosuccinate synthase
MRNLDIADSRSKLEQYAAQPSPQLDRAYLFGELEAGIGTDTGGADRIAANPGADEQPLADDAVLDIAAIEEGVD